MEWEKLLSTERFAGRGRDREESSRSDYRSEERRVRERVWTRV